LRLTPNFQPQNPYWQRTPVAGTLLPKTQTDFLYAAYWEAHHADPHAAYCVRAATVLTTILNFRLQLRNQVKEMLHDKRKEVH